MKRIYKQYSAITLAALLGAGAIAPAGSAQAAYEDMTQAGAYQSDLSQLVAQKVLSGYEDGSLKPQQAVSRAELAKMLLLALNPAPAAEAGSGTLADVPAGAWYAEFAQRSEASGIISAENGRFLPEQTVSVQLLVESAAKAAGVDKAVVRSLLQSGTDMSRQATRAETAHVLVGIQQLKNAEAEQVISIRSLNAITLEVVFSKPLPKEDIDAAKAEQNFKFEGGIVIQNIPQLKTGFVSTYIVPVSPQKAGTVYSLLYKGTASGTFEGNDSKAFMTGTRQISADTIEVESDFAAGITDYQNIVAVHTGKRGGLDFILDENNSYQGKAYHIISSMRAKQVKVTPENGEALIATYVPFTQATDGRQAPKFRLPAGQTLQPGVNYTVTAEWADIEEPKFQAADIALLTITSARALDNASVEVTLGADPQDELLAGRQVTLTAADGMQLTAQYRFVSRKGATGIFDIQNGGTLAADTTYTISAVGGWAQANGTSVTLN